MWISGVLSLVGLSILAGCRTTTGTATVTVHVRDQQSQHPVADALVQAEAVHFYVPEYPFWIIDFNPSFDARRVTDTDGSARIDLPQECPVRINIVAAGYEPLEAYLTDRSIWPQTGQWIDIDPQLGQSSGSRLEIRFAD
jgi:hypothetical protein